MNKVILIGRLTKDPELTQTQSGVSVCKFNLAVDRGFKDADGNKQADFIPIVIWREKADNCAKYLAKGSQCAIIGQMQTRSYEANDGSKRYVTEVIADNVEFLGSKTDSNSNAQAPKQAPPKQRKKMDELAEIDDENLPF